MKTNSHVKELEQFLTKIESNFNFVKITKEGHLKTDTGLRVVQQLRTSESSKVREERLPVQVIITVATKERALINYGSSTNEENAVMIAWFRKMEYAIRKKLSDQQDEIEMKMRALLL